MQSDGDAVAGGLCDQSICSGVGAAEPALEPGLCSRQMASGRRFRALSMVDDVKRKCLAAVPDTSISGRRGVRELTTDRSMIPGTR